MAKHIKKILSGSRDIGDYIGVSAQTARKYIVELGLPAAIIYGKYVSHTDNVDEFFRRLTAQRTIDEIED